MFREIFISLSLIAGILPATSQTRVTLEECRSDALEYNKSLDMARMDVKYAEEAVKVARTSYFPAVDASGTFMYLPDFEGISIPGFFCQLPKVRNPEMPEIIRVPVPAMPSFPE